MNFDQKMIICLLLPGDCIVSLSLQPQMLQLLILPQVTSIHGCCICPTFLLLLSFPVVHGLDKFDCATKLCPPIGLFAVEVFLIKTIHILHC